MNPWLVWASGASAMLALSALGAEHPFLFLPIAAVSAFSLVKGLES